MTPKDMIAIKSDYIRENLPVPLGTAGKAVGNSDSWLGLALKKGLMRRPHLERLCDIYGLDIRQASAEEPKKEPKKKQDLTEALTQNTELVTEYIKDLGKIQTDILRELKETRREQKELLEKLTKAFHELDVFARNFAPDMKAQHMKEANTLNILSNYIQQKGEQIVCRK